MSKRHLSLHRRARLIAWALAMLTWMAQVLFADAPFTQRHARRRGPRMSLAGLTHMVRQLIIVRAADLARQRPKSRFNFHYRGYDRTPRAVIRAVIGARVRRMLKRDDLAARIGVLIHALNHLDQYASIVARRLRRRLTRLWPILAAPAAFAVQLIEPACAVAAFDDSS
ncbi:MAG TPA: hypothetical protein VEA80_17230 [Vitreimonas sp.]|uniref:hypothetical protein n=1 Tax=Vitreimonas sp. TaxID=3069702 RepID=UPI002D4FB1D8|nr:hypothetical protein [Vitreimonas sp.]HYD89225.1 hypothetical protein [Vitreimonas sp.]